MRTNLTPAAILMLIVAATATENTDPDGDGSQYAYGENVGWLNAEPLGDGGPGVRVEDFELTGWFWGENVGWVSLAFVHRGESAQGQDRLDLRSTSCTTGGLSGPAAR